jgi:predicted metal-dependent HD superfamily phosphohydrolase
MPTIEAELRYEGDLQKRWRRLVRPDHQHWTWRLLQTLYGESHRKYHTLQHIRACLNCLDSLTMVSEDVYPVELALWLHDAVYVPGSTDNEVMSAELTNVLGPALERSPPLSVWSAILMTRHKDDSFMNSVSDTVVDIDLSILGETPAIYAEYVRKVRAEFDISNDAWRSGRMVFLAGMLARKRIYRLSEMRQRYENQARINMKGELERLERGGSP